MNLNNFSLIRGLIKNKHIYTNKINGCTSNITPLSSTLRYEQKLSFNNNNTNKHINNKNNNNSNSKSPTNSITSFKTISLIPTKSTILPSYSLFPNISLNNQIQRYYCASPPPQNGKDNKNNNKQEQQNENNNKQEEQNESKSKYSYKEGIFAFVQKFIEKVKYFLTRNKPLTSDQRIALISWAAFGTGTLVLIGTTSLVSFILFFANTFEFSEFLANKVGKYLTNNTGITITFESARGDMKTGYIRLENVNISRTPRIDDRLSSIQLSIRQIDIKLNFLWFLEGKGLIQECLVNGVRGLIDRRTEGVYYNVKNMIFPRRKKLSGDFEFEKLEVRDLLITMFLPDKSHRPLSISIYHLETDKFRKQWMLLDILSCKSIVGKFDNSLFTLTIPQHHRPFNTDSDDLLSKKLKEFTSSSKLLQNRGGSNHQHDNYYNYITEPTDNLYLTQSNLEINNINYNNSNSTGNGIPTTGTMDNQQQQLINGSGKKILKKRDEKLEYRELKIDGLNTDILSRNATGPLGWIKEGTFDIDLLILLPNHVTDNEKELLNSEQMEYGIIPASDNPRMNLHLDFKVQLNHLYSVAPLYTPEISYISNALAHPIVAYINSHSKHIPLSFKFAMNVRQFNGSWTPSQASFWEMISASVYEELLNKVQGTKNVTTLKKVASDLVNDLVQWIAPHLQTLQYHQKELEEKEEQEKLSKLNQVNQLTPSSTTPTLIDNIQVKVEQQQQQKVEQQKQQQQQDQIDEEDDEEPINQQLIYYQEMQKLLDSQNQKQQFVKY